MRLKTIYFTILLSVNSLSCQHVPNETTSKTQVKYLNERVDSIFKFKNKVYTIFEDSKSNFWIGTKENGVCKFDGKTYTYFTTKDGLASNSIPSIQEDINGNIWFDGGGEISKFDGKEFTVFKKENILKGDIKNHPIKLSNNDLYFRYKNDFGIYRYDGIELSFIEFQKPKPNKVNGRLGFGVTGLTNLVDSKVWFGTSYAGAFGFDGKYFEVLNNQSLGLDSENSFLHIRSILADSKGKIWIGNNGIGVVLKDGNSIINFSEKHGKLLPLNEFDSNLNKNKGLKAVFAIEEDGEGNIWFGDRDSGAWKYDGRNLTNYSTIDNSLNEEDIIWDIFNDQKGNLWFILTNGTMYKFNGQSFGRFEGFDKKK